MTITWLWRSPDGLIRIGFIAASGSMPAAAACTACARPISLPSRATTEFSAMFCALNGATLTPRRCSQRQMPAVTTDLPASECVPQTRIAPFIARPSARRGSRTSQEGCGAGRRAPPRQGPPGRFARRRARPCRARAGVTVRHAPPREGRRRSAVPGARPCRRRPPPEPSQPPTRERHARGRAHARRGHPDRSREPGGPADVLAARRAPVAERRRSSATPP